MKFFRLIPSFLLVAFIALWATTKIMTVKSDDSHLLNKSLPSFNLTTAFNPQKIMSSANLQKPALLVFWASWCGVCQVDMPVLGAFAQQHNIPLYGIAYHDQPQPLLRAVTTMAPTVTFAGLAMDNNGMIASQFGILGIPTLFVIDSVGVVKYVAAGQVSKRLLEHQILPLLH